MWFFKKGKKKKIGEMLIDKGLATEKDIENALKIQKELWQTQRIQKSIGAILSEKGLVDLEDIKKVLEEQKRMEGFILKGLVYSIFHSAQPK